MGKRQGCSLQDVRSKGGVPRHNADDAAHNMSSKVVSRYYEPQVLRNKSGIKRFLLLFIGRNRAESYAGVERIHPAIKIWLIGLYIEALQKPSGSARVG